MTVRPATAADEAAWRRLWAGYCSFYETSVPEAVTATTWARILDPDQPVICRVAEVDGTVVGFAVCVLHLGTWSPKTVCYLEDLFVDPTVRGQGLGRALIEALAAEGRAAGWSRLYWQTRADNAAAQALYDRITPMTDWRRYDLVLTSS